MLNTSKLALPKNKKVGPAWTQGSIIHYQAEWRPVCWNVDDDDFHDSNFELLSYLEGT
jgi:hypothetical protein